MHASPAVTSKTQSSYADSEASFELLETIGREPDLSPEEVDSLLGITFETFRATETRIFLEQRLSRDLYLVSGDCAVTIMRGQDHKSVLTESLASRE